MTEDKARARLDYQRDFMRARRKRVAKALALAVMTGGPMTRAAMRERERALSGRWAAAKVEWLAANAAAYPTRRQAVAAFWAELDQRLDANLAAAQRTKAAPGG